MSRLPPKVIEVKRLLPKYNLPILFRYILSEINAPFFLTLFIVTSILFLVRSLALFDLVVNKNVPAGDMLLLFSYIIPRFLELAIPMSLLLGIILAFSRLSGDSELVVMRAVGISLKQLVLPVMSFAGLCVLATFFIACWLRPWANYKLEEGTYEIAKLQASSGLIAGAFNEIGPLTIYAEKILDSGHGLNKVLLADRRDPLKTRTIFARNGSLSFDDSNQTLTMHLFNGSILEKGVDANSFSTTFFEINHLSVSNSELFGGGIEGVGKKSSELPLVELLEKKSILQQKLSKNSEEHAAYLELTVEFHRRIALPVSCLCIALVAMALGVQPSRGGKTWGMASNIILGIFTIIAYYFAMAMVAVLSERDIGPAWLLMWLPNLGAALIGGFLFRQIGEERWMAVSDAISEVLKNMLFYLQSLTRPMGNR